MRQALPPMLAALLLTGCATPRDRPDPPPVACADVEPEQCVERHRGALSLCHRYHAQAQRRAEDRSREAELWQWTALGATGVATTLGIVVSVYATTPLDL